jgi:hypothetical protein
MRHRLIIFIIFALISVSLLAQNTVLLNVSYDPTRELYQEINTVFMQQWKQQTRVQFSSTGRMLQTGARRNAKWDSFSRIALIYAEKSAVYQRRSASVVLRSSNCSRRR